MCGIAGIVAAHSLERLIANLDQLSCGLQHRGPDDVGFLTYDGQSFSLGRQPSALRPGRLALVHRRLSIFDLSERGWQPMIDATGRYAIIFNGEIYNHPELRRELEQEEVSFRSNTDTEVLLHLLMRSGTAALNRVVGMFAFAFLDAAAGRLLLARDPFGIKPLFYAATGGIVAFASEIRPLLDGGFAQRDIEPGALFDYLRHGVTDHGQRTLVGGVFQLPPAHTLLVDVETATLERPRRYWAPSLAPRHYRNVDAAAEELRALFTESVELHLRADVPVVATLSGGIDSSAIVATARRLRPAEQLAVFSYVADEPALNEEPYLDLAAEAAAVRPHKIRLAADALAGDLDRLILIQQQPFTTTSIWAQSRVFREVRDRGFKVVLDGQGADELFAGYPVFRSAHLATLIKRGQWGTLARLMRTAQVTSHDALRAFESVVPRPLRRFARSVVGRPAIPDWLESQWFSRFLGSFERPVEAIAAPTQLTAELYDALAVSSLPMLLRYADRNAMTVSLENRVPFLTTRLAEFALSLPDSLRISSDGTTKYLLRKALRGIVPDRILNRRDKIGFATPEARWFGESAVLRAQLLQQLERPLPPCFAPAMSDRLRAVAAGKAPYSGEVWRTWNVLRWAELMRLAFPA
jgi:asparagine synthase (glutamine-hydrolysing)